MKTIVLEEGEYTALLTLLSRTTLQGTEVKGYVNLINKIQKEAIAKPIKGDTESKAD